MSSKNEPNMFVFATVLCLVCSVLLTFSATSLKERQDLNIKLDKQKNVLKAMELYLEGIDVGLVYSTSVKDKWIDETGRIVDQPGSESDLPIYINSQSGSIVSYALPVSGYGLWSTIYGFLAIEGDGKTVKGISFYQHGETPGLGAEIEKEWFTSQFKGKSIVDRNNSFVSVGVVKGKVVDTVPKDKQHNYVDGISGATITAKGVEKFVKSDLEKYELFSKGLR